jgi:hypothetical protein
MLRRRPILWQAAAAQFVHSRTPLGLRCRNCLFNGARDHLWRVSARYSVTYNLSNAAAHDYVIPDTANTGHGGEQKNCYSESVKLTGLCVASASRALLLSSDPK